MKDIQGIARQVGNLLRVAAFSLLFVSFSAGAQGVLSNTQTGTIQAEAQDDGYLTIGGRNLNYSDEITVVFLNGEQVSNEVLDEGMVVRYTLNGEGMLTRIEILGPINLIQPLVDN